jgi:hypothetical protein
MRTIRAVAAAATALLAALAIPAPAHAQMLPPQPFYADSGDACTYGYTKGTLLWRTPGPLPAISVEVTGAIVDRPTPTEPSFCREDGFYSTATFTAYSEKVIVDSGAVRADNLEVPFQLTLGANSASSPLTHLVVQVCRDPLVIKPPSYCGPSVTYRPTAITPRP